MNLTIVIAIDQLRHVNGVFYFIKYKYCKENIDNCNTTILIDKKEKVLGPVKK